MEEVNAALAAVDSDDPAVRLAALLDAYNPRTLAAEPWARATLRAVLDAWLKANEGDVGKSFCRVPLRIASQIDQ